MIKMYKHTQSSYLMVIVLDIAVLYIVCIMVVSGFNFILLTVIIFLGFCSASFSALITIVDENFLSIIFGFGLIRKKFLLEDIESVKVVKNPWYYGWGIRLIPDGWLFNVSGFLAVEIRMKTGKKYRVGTDDPDNLAKSIQESLMGKSEN